MTKEDIIFLKHILESIRNIETYTMNMPKEKFMRLKMRKDAVLKNLEIIGEATKRLSVGLKEKNSQVVWRKIAGLRDILTHQYFGIDDDTVWEVIIKDLPRLKEDIQEIIRELEHQK